MAPDDDRVNASSMGGTVDLQAFENISNGWAGGECRTGSGKFPLAPAKLARDARNEENYDEPLPG
jgi:hypothetical protein